MERFTKILVALGLICGLATVSAVSAEEMIDLDAAAMDDAQWAEADLDECVQMMVEEGLSEDEAKTECDAILSDDMADVADEMAADVEQAADAVAKDMMEDATK